MLNSVDGIPFDFSFTNIRQYGNSLSKKNYESVSELLDDFYFEKDKINRTKRKAADLFKLLNSAIERTSRKINNRCLELEKSENREEIKYESQPIRRGKKRAYKTYKKECKNNCDSSNCGGKLVFGKGRNVKSYGDENHSHEQKREKISEKEPDLNGCIGNKEKEIKRG